MVQSDLTRISVYAAFCAKSVHFTSYTTKHGLDQSKYSNISTNPFNECSRLKKKQVYLITFSLSERNYSVYIIVAHVFINDFHKHGCSISRNHS